jgi:hypothetical protein
MTGPDSTQEKEMPSDQRLDFAVVITTVPKFFSPMSAEAENLVMQEIPHGLAYSRVQHILIGLSG